MFAVLIFPGGRRADAVLLAAEDERLRFAVSGRADITELQQNAGRWVDECGEPVELGALLAIGATAQPKKRLRAMAVGRPS